MYRCSFLMVKGVVKIESGYSGGYNKAPTYNKVCAGGTGHAEVAKIEYDPQIISYRQLLDIFFFIHDPTTPDGQGNDMGISTGPSLIASRSYLPKLENLKKSLKAS